MKNQKPCIGCVHRDRCEFATGEVVSCNGFKAETAKSRYRKACKSRNVSFYKHEQELYEFSKTINFQKFVKECLRDLKIIKRK